jgi:hypothetical protein
MEIVQTLEEVPDKTSDWGNIFLGSFKVCFWPKPAAHQELY